MLSISWPQWIATRLTKKSFRRPRIERLHVSLSLERLEKRELLTTAVPLVINQTQQTAVPLSAPGSTGYTPSQISKAYGFDQIYFNNGTIKGDGTGQTIAIVSAYNDPNILNDLNVFSVQFGLRTASLSVLNQTGGYVLPEADPTGSWATEDALDVEWAHAMAPGANLVLVEANTDNISDLLAAARTAADMPGVSVVSMSWGNAEFPNEVNYDSYFTTPAGHTGVTFVAASGDSGAPPIYPATSPNVLAVGGTTLSVDSQGNYVNETGWSGSGGGISAYEPQPGYQQNVATQSTTQRTSPDVAYDADSATGFAVYDSYQDSAGTGPWIVTAGTSAGAPQWSALIAIANQGRALAGEAALDGPSQTMPLIYQMPGSYFHDVLTGSSTGNPSYSAGPGYDLVTGRGSPRADKVVSYLVGSSTSPQTPPPSPGSSPTPSPTEPGTGNHIQDGNFGFPSVGANQILNPTGSPWLFLGWSGIAGNGSTLTVGNAPAPGGGLQVAFLYNQGSSILQSVSLSAGTYVLIFQAAQADTIANSQEQIEVVVGGIVVALITPGPGYSTYTEVFKVPSSGNYTLQFEGMAPNDGNAALLDDVILEGLPPDSSPAAPSTPPSHSPGAPPPSPSPSPAPSKIPSSQPPQGSSDSTAQPLLSILYDFLLSDLLFIQTTLNQILQTTNTTAAIQLVPDLNGLSQQQAVGLLIQQWEMIEPLLSE